MANGKRGRWKPVIAAVWFFFGATCFAQQRDVVDRLIERIVAEEQEFLAAIKQYRPVLETYLQEAPQEPTAASAGSARDHYMIGRLDLRAGVDQTVFASSHGFQPRRRKGGLLHNLFDKSPARAVFLPRGFAQMVLPDAYEFNRETYRFEYVRREFLGEVRCFVFDVAPRDEKAPGKFVGRVWVEDEGFHIVRFNGTYTRSKATSLFFHFDSWRVNVQPGLWVPAAVYVQDASRSGEEEGGTRFKAQTRIWGYQTSRGKRLEELTEILVESKKPVRDEAETPGPSPLESQRIWRRQAEKNVLERLERSGLLAPRGEVDAVLNTVVKNLLVTNDIPLEVQCRVLLTTPLETFSIGQAIVISRGLLDVLPDEASLAMVLSDELAHIVLEHHTETMYAFSDLTMFDDKEILDRLRLNRPRAEIEAAGKKAVEMLSRSPYKDSLASAGLFLRALAKQAPRLPNLIRANLGNQLASGDNLVRFTELAGRAPELDESKIEQLAALPLGSRIQLDPWSNEIRLIKTRKVALRSARDKLSFAVTPFVLPLTRVRAEEPAAERTDDR